MYYFGRSTYNISVATNDGFIEEKEYIYYGENTFRKFLRKGGKMSSEDIVSSSFSSLNDTVYYMIRNTYSDAFWMDIGIVDYTSSGQSNISSDININEINLDMLLYGVKMEWIVPITDTMKTATKDHYLLVDKDLSEYIDNFKNVVIIHSTAIMIHCEDDIAMMKLCANKKQLKLKYYNNEDF